MAYATAYSNLLYDSKPLDYKVSSDWLSKVAEQRNAMYMQNYQKIESYKSKALNLNLLNPVAQAKADEYNKEIETFFKDTDLSKVDLADVKVSNKYLDIFKKLDTDANFNRTYRLDNEMKSVLGQWKEAAKNPNKTGFSTDNQIVWQNEYLDRYMKETDMSKIPMLQAGQFDPHYDYMKEIIGLKGMLHFDGKKFEVNNGAGKKEIIDKTELNDVKIQTLLKAGLSGKAVNQILKEGKSMFYQNYNSLPEGNKDSFALEMYNNDKKRVTDTKKEYDKAIAEIDGKLKVANLLTEEKKLQLLEQRKAYAEQRDGLVFTSNEKDYLSLDKFGLAQRYAQVRLHDKINQTAKAMAYKIEKVTSESDRAFWDTKNFELKVSNEEFDRKMQNADLLLKSKQLELNEKRLDIEQQKADTASTKAGSAKDKKLEKDSNGFFVGYGTDENVSGTITVEQLTGKINEFNAIYQKGKSQETLTPTSVLDIMRNDNSVYGNTLRDAAKSLGIKDNVTPSQLGSLKVIMDGHMKNGSLAEYFNENEEKLRFYSGIKDATFNKLFKEKFPHMAGKSSAEISSFFAKNSTLAKPFREAWELEINKNMTSYNSSTRIIGVEGEKNTANLEVISQVMNSPENKGILKQIGITENFTITKDMIESATYKNDNIGKTATMKVTFKQKAVQENSGLNKISDKINSRTYEFKVPNTIMDNIDKDKMSVSDMNFIATKEKNTSYKGFDIKLFAKTDGTIGYSIKTPTQYISSEAPSGANAARGGIQADRASEVLKLIHDQIDKGAIK